jgi:uncharacterized protein (DUF2147 family)
MVNISGVINITLEDLMKRIIMSLFIAAFAVLCVPSLHAADSAEGYWKSIDEKGKVTAFWKMWVEGNELRGTIVKVPNQADSTLCTECKKDSAAFYNKPIIGTLWMWGFKKDGDKWTKGKIVDSGKGDVYWASVKVIDGGNSVEMRGSIDRWGMAGKTQVWKRSNEAEAKAGKAN